MTKKEQLKQLITAMGKTVCSASELLGIDADASDICKTELAMFMMYLSASDGEIKWEEAMMISDLCDLNLSPNNISTFIKENNIYSTDFEKKVPACVQVLVTTDNKLVEMGADIDGDILDIILTTYKGVGEVFINSDGDSDDTERSDLRIYLNMLTEYITKNSKRKRTGVATFEKKGGTVSAPTKTGVSAPKKG